MLEKDKSEEAETLDVSTVNSYKQLNDKCDAVISKIKGRKGKKTTQQTGE
jgi:hypothetical protein